MEICDEYHEENHEAIMEQNQNENLVNKEPIEFDENELENNHKTKPKAKYIFNYLHMNFCFNFKILYQSCLIRTCRILLDLV